MKKWNKLIISAVIAVSFSFNFVYAAALSQPQQDNTQMLEQIKEKRELIKHHQERDEELGKQIEKKMQVLEQLLLKLPENGVLPQEQMQKQLEEMLGAFMENLMRLSESEMSMWKHLEKANKLIANGKYSQGIKHLDKTIEVLEEEHKMIVEFDKLIDDFIEMVKSFDLK